MRATRNEWAVLCPVFPRVRSSGLPSNPPLEQTGVEAVRDGR